MAKNKESLSLVVSEKAKIEERISRDPAVGEVLKVSATLAAEKVQAIKNEEQESHIGLLLCTSKSMIKDLNARERYFLEPLKIQKKIIESFFSVLRAPFQVFNRDAETRLGKYARDKQEAARKAQDKADKELKRQVKKLEKVGVKLPVPKIAAAPAKTVVKTSAGSLYQKTVIEVELVDLALVIKKVAAGDLPPEILNIVDINSVVQVAAKEVVKNKLPVSTFAFNERTAKSLVTKGRSEIPGVKVSQDVKIQTRT